MNIAIEQQPPQSKIEPPTQMPIKAASEIPNLLSMSETSSEESEPEVDDGDEVGDCWYFLV